MKINFTKKQMEEKKLVRWILKIERAGKDKSRN